MHEAYAAAIARAAGAWSRLDHRQDPVATSYLQRDGIHPGNKGRTVIAETLADPCYRTVTAPR